MDRGEIVEEGATKEFFLNPKEERTKQFLKEIDGLFPTIQKAECNL
jgi:ABC-type methionine transport system ATPase subunit